jgi:hypothetical protein
VAFPIWVCGLLRVSSSFLTSSCCIRWQLLNPSATCRSLRKTRDHLINKLCFHFRHLLNRRFPTVLHISSFLITPIAASSHCYCFCQEPSKRLQRRLEWKTSFTAHTIRTSSFCDSSASIKNQKIFPRSRQSPFDSLDFCQAINLTKIYLDSFFKGACLAALIFPVVVLISQVLLHTG